MLDGRGGAVVKSKPTYRRPTSPAQAASEARMRVAVAVAGWSSFSAAKADLWRAWGAPRGMTQTAFVALATKVLQVGAFEAPRTPPETDFVEDDVAIAVSEPLPLGEGQGWGRGREAPPPYPPQGGGGGILLVAQGATRAGSLVEVVTQRLPNERRSPTKDYATAAFLAFPEGSPTAFLPPRALHRGARNPAGGRADGASRPPCASLAW